MTLMISELTDQTAKVTTTSSSPSQHIPRKGHKNMEEIMTMSQQGEQVPTSQLPAQNAISSDPHSNDLNPLLEQLHKSQLLTLSSNGRFAQCKVTPDTALPTIKIMSEAGFKYIETSVKLNGTKNHDLYLIFRDKADKSRFRYQAAKDVLLAQEDPSYVLHRIAGTDQRLEQTSGTREILTMNAVNLEKIFITTHEW